MRLLIFFLIFASEITYAADITLLGYVNGGKAENSSAVFLIETSIWYDEDTRVIRVNNSIYGFQLVGFRGRGVLLRKGNKEWLVLPGTWVTDGKPLRGDDHYYPYNVPLKGGLEVQDKEVSVSVQLRDYIKADGLLKILWQAAAVPEVDGAGDVYGYRLWEIEEGSIYDLAGFKDGDLFLEIDNQKLTSPLMAVRMLNAIKDKDEFTFKFSRSGVEYEKTVRVQ